MIEEIRRRWPVTVELGLMALIIGLIIALPVGIYSAVRQDTWGDYLSRSFAILCIAVPSFWIGTLLIVMPSLWWNAKPALGYIWFSTDPLGNLKQMLLPSIVLGMAAAGSIMRMTRTMMLEVLRQDYIRTAWAKGLRERIVIIRHALKNALIPVVTLIGFWLPIMVGGAVVVETIFTLPGMGYLIIDATQYRDYAVLSGVMFIVSLGMVVINLIVDISYAYLDPRVHYR